jgi:hypothetical protein
MGAAASASADGVTDTHLGALNGRRCTVGRCGGLIEFAKTKIAVAVKSEFVAFRTAFLCPITVSVLSTLTPTPPAPLALLLEPPYWAQSITSLLLLINHSA